MPDTLMTSPREAPRLAATHRGAFSLFLSLLLTYVRRPLAWCWPLGNAILCGFVSYRTSPMTDPRSTGLSQSEPLPYDGVFLSGFLLACAAGFFVATVTGHFVQILRPPGGQVVPRLRVTALAANIVLTLSLILGLTAIWPHPTVTVVTGSVEPHFVAVPIHALALVAILAAQLGWTQFAPITGAVTIFGWGVLSYPQARAATLRMLIGQSPVLEVATAALGGILFVGLWVAIARRRDRNFEVDPILESLRRKLFGDDDAAAPAPAASPFGGTIPALVPPRTFTAASRRRLHRRALAGGSAPVFAGLLVGLALVALVYILRAFGLEHMDAVTPRVLIYMVSIVPAALVSASAMENRGPLITHGLLLPQHRRQFVGDVGLAMLANLFTLWIAAVLPILLLLTLDVPDRVRPASVTLTAILAIAAAYQFFALGVIAWLLRLNHRIVIMIVQTAGCALGIPIISLNPGRALMPVAIGIAVAFTVTGLAFARTAYSTWADSEPPSAGPSKTAAAL